MIAVTLRDVANMLGISHTTVSRALRNHPQIPKEHRMRIHAAAKKMGYHPNPAAAALSRQRFASDRKPVQAVIAWLNLWPDPKQLRQYQEFDRYWLGASAAAEKFGYRLEDFHCPDLRALHQLERILSARGIHAILLPPGCRTAPDLAALNWESFCIIRLGRSLASPQTDLVTSNQVANSAMAFDEIRARGYRRIGWVEWQKPWESSRMFKAGFLLAQSRVVEQLRVSPLSLRPDHSAAAGKILKRWLKQEKPDALLTDMAEIPVMLKSCGYRVPEDIGLAVNSVLDGNADAGVDQNPLEIGRIAVLALISLVNDNDHGIPPIQREILINGSWVDGSTLPARETAAPHRLALSSTSRIGAG